jgi:hypothetical protein
MEKIQALLWPNMVRPKGPLHISPGQRPCRYTQIPSVEAKYPPRQG